MTSKFCWMLSSVTPSDLSCLSASAALGHAESNHAHECEDKSKEASSSCACCATCCFLFGVSSCLFQVVKSSPVSFLAAHHAVHGSTRDSSGLIADWPSFSQ